MNLRLIGTTVFSMVLAACGGGGQSATTSPPPVTSPPPPPAPLTTGAAACSDGRAGDFDCDGVALEQRVPLADMGGQTGNDIWGWVDSTTGKEYALMGMTNGTAFVDVTDPQGPIVLGLLPTATVSSTWRDIKVYADHAYIVADAAGSHGMQVFDLTRLRTASGNEQFSPDVVYGDFGSTHNLAINEESGFAFAVGSDTCAGGLHMIDLSTPNNPVFAGCHTAVEVHDTQCVRYVGPDTDHSGAEICLSSAEDVVEIADVSNKSSTVTLAALAYPDLGFVHQAWLTPDQRYLLVGDELDERSFGVNTRTIVLDVSNLDNPVYAGRYEAATRSIDHNLYIDGNRVYQANYTSGLRVLEIIDPAMADLAEIAYFDTHPAGDAADFDGAWSVYPFLPSGTILVSDIQEGLFLLRLQ